MPFPPEETRMKKVSLTAVALVVLGSTLPAAARPPQVADPPAPPTVVLPGQPEWASDRVIVRLGEGAIPHRSNGRWAFRRAGRVDRESLTVLSEAGAAQVRPALRVPAARAASAARLGLDRTYIVELPAGSDAAAIATRLSRLATVERAEVDGLGGLAGDAPNDPRFPEQWNFRNTGQFAGGLPGLPGADIDALGAWDLGTGDDSIVVGLLDSGINEHVDLAGRILPGWNIPQNSDDTSDFCSSHGTGVGSLLGARGDDGIGMAGVNWSVRFLPFVVVNPCTGSESWVAEAIVLAVDGGADILNMSLAYNVGSDLLHNAVLYAAEAGVTMVAASGNTAAASLAYPARWPEVIAVGASTNQDVRWSSSSYGSNLALVAPGAYVLRATGYATYSTTSGTSFAVPLVSGTITLMLARNPYLTPGQIRSILEQTADDLEDPGYDLFTGYGRLNAAAAVAATPLPGDLDGDGSVGGSDLTVVLSGWGICEPDAPCPGDINHDGVVDGVDLSIVLGGWTG